MSQSITPAIPSGQAGPEGPLGAPPVVASQPEPAIAQALFQLEELARQLEGQPEALLSLLRSLEQLHRSIQDGPFRSSLPADRNDLFRLLSEMERSGGWPYIPRLQLRTFLDLLSQGAGADVLSEIEAGPQAGQADTPRLAA
jgi:hypothetical protein